MKPTITPMRTLAFAVLGLCAQPAIAGTATSSFPVNATIATACSLSSSAMNFGEVGVTGGTTIQTDSTSAITVTCTPGGEYYVSLDGGLHAVAAQRMAQSGAHVLAYDLYKDSARGTVWTNVTAAVYGTGDGTAQTITIYGRVAAGLPSAPSSFADYTDTVVVTLTY